MTILNYFADFSLFGGLILTARLNRGALRQHLLPIEFIIVKAVYFIKRAENLQFILNTENELF